MYIQYTCDIRFLFTAHAFMISIDLPFSLSLSWHSRSTSWNTYDQGPPHMYTHSPLGRLAPLLSSSRPDTGSRGTSQCTPDCRIPVWDRLEVTRAMWADLRVIYVNGVIPLYISLSLEQQWAMQWTLVYILGLLLGPMHVYFSTLKLVHGLGNYTPMYSSKQTSFPTSTMQCFAVVNSKPG